MYRTSKSKQWFIQIIDLDNKEIISVYDNGLVYGTERGQKKAKLNQEAVNRLKGILIGKFDQNGNPFNETTIYNRTNYMYLFKNNPDMVYYSNKKILKIRDDSRKNRKIQVVGWNVITNLLAIIENSNNWV